MIGPNDINLPFFAYGVFRKGELGFLSISDLVSRVVEPCSVTGSLLLRDGLPIIDPAGRSNVPGSLISFREGLNSEAYDRIDRLEPHRVPMGRNEDCSKRAVQLSYRALPT